MIFGFIFKNLATLNYIESLNNIEAMSINICKTIMEL